MGTLEVPRMETRFGEVMVTHSARGVPTFRVEAFHDGHHRNKVIRAGDGNTLRNRCTAQAHQWNSAWAKLSHIEQANRQFNNGNQAAISRTTEAKQVLDALRSILVGGIENSPALDWEQLKLTIPFSLAAPISPVFEPEPSPIVLPNAPDLSNLKYQPALSLLDRLISSRKAFLVSEARERFLADTSCWEDFCAASSDEWHSRLAAVRGRNSRLQECYVQTVHKWEQEKLRFEEEQEAQHAAIDDLHRRYDSQSPGAVLRRWCDSESPAAFLECCERLLLNSDYPACIPREFDFEFTPETGLLLVACRLPAPADLPRLAEVRYIKTTNTLAEKFLSEAQAAQLYDDVLYQITLRTIHELFQSDSARALSTVVLNGIVTSTNRSTGNETTACVLSVQASREAFMAFNLAKVDPKACFRELKGVGSSKLHSITAIAPIVDLRRDDNRFIPSYDVAERLNTGSNLATMDWEEFEHLIREIFQKEFSSSGGEVKVTQASRDGGVDAIAFDPDPIRGGKIVIQAKRYSYTVGVSAVRDLYGTVMNEGANKGILVTTSDFGPDAYEFAKGKPLTLYSGSNLLHLLMKHGVSAHINLAQGRQAARERFGRDGAQDEKP